mmetsp:Transcript_2679/g.3469  ORF Transcript_2679/g.3469 Transcript_2679/m.3469 type:complete len:91 (-) Transcript_2679:119-391(-)
MVLSILDLGQLNLLIASIGGKVQRCVSRHGTKARPQHFSLPRRSKTPPNNTPPVPSTQSTSNPQRRFERLNKAASASGRKTIYLLPDVAR